MNHEPIDVNCIQSVLGDCSHGTETLKQCVTIQIQNKRAKNEGRSLGNTTRSRLRAFLKRIEKTEFSSCEADCSVRIYLLSQ